MANVSVLKRGFESCSFTVNDLAMAVSSAAAGGESGESGEVGEVGEAAWPGAGGVGEVAARAAARCPLARDVCQRAAELTAPPLRLRLLRDLPPHAPAPPLWFDETILAAIRMPFLTLANIKGGGIYECHECGARFERPNPLKLHLFMDCGEFEVRAFWARALPRLAAALEPAGGLVAGGLAAGGLAAGGLAAGGPADCGALPPAARLEALAAEWGRARGGHTCVYCGKLYSRKYGLKIHIRTHTGYKPLRCAYCARAFGDPSNLNKHVRLHAGHAPRASRRRLQRLLKSRHALCTP